MQQNDKAKAIAKDFSRFWVASLFCYHLFAFGFFPAVSGVIYKHFGFGPESFFLVFLGASLVLSEIVVLLFFFCRLAEFEQDLRKNSRS